MFKALKHLGLKLDVDFVLDESGVKWITTPPAQEEINNAMIYVQSHPPVPTEITPRQLRLALLQIGLLDDVEAAVTAADVDGDRALGIWWNYALGFERSHPLVAQMAAAIGADSDAADAVWRLGATL